jgi:lipoate-protein ligase A
MSGTGSHWPELAVSVPFRLILDDSASGAWNMALDEALLESVSEGNSGPVVRFYAFDPDTLSTGRFQNVRDEFDLEALRREGVTIVRRPSGGRAVLHNNELTYAVILGRQHLHAFSKRRAYAFTVPLLLAGLEELGVRSVENRELKGDLRNPDCFAATGQYEIGSHEGRKLIGSAQMITRTAVLQHGSIPIAPEDRNIARFLKAGAAAPEELHNFTTIADELGMRPDYPTVRGAFAAAVRRLVPCTDSVPTARERERAEELVREKYSRSSWNLSQ